MRGGGLDMTELEGRITPHFTVEEVDSRGYLHINPEMIAFITMLEELRMWAARHYPQFAKQGLIPSNIYRTEEHNNDVGGDKNSTHLDGRAADITNIPQGLFKDFTVAWQLICSIHGKVGGVNYYKWGMHFTDHEDKFGHTEFQIRDYR
jgi:hypothetical protein